jgi:hypothetical protein
MTNLKRARDHLRPKHRIYVREEQSDNSKRQKGTIEDIIGKQVQRQEGSDIEQEKLLVNAINKAAFKRLWLDLWLFVSPIQLLNQAILLSLNYMAKDVVIQPRRSVPPSPKSTLRKAPSIPLVSSLDMWTASEAKKAYQAIVAHFVDFHTRATTLISLREFKAGHGGEDQAKVFLEVIDQYELRSFFTMDNADSNDRMLRCL